MRIVETDNFGRDYQPDEQFLNLPMLSRERAKAIADCINGNFPGSYDRFWKVVDDDYQLKRPAPP